MWILVPVLVGWKIKKKKKIFELFSLLYSMQPKHSFTLSKMLLSGAYLFFITWVKNISLLYTCILLEYPRRFHLFHFIWSIQPSGPRTNTFSEKREAQRGHREPSQTTQVKTTRCIFWFQAQHKLKSSIRIIQQGSFYSKGIWQHITAFV